MPAPRYPGADVESLFRGAPVCRRQTIQRVEKIGVAAASPIAGGRRCHLATVTADLSQWEARFGVASEGQGAPRSQ